MLRQRSLLAAALLCIWSTTYASALDEVDPASWAPEDAVAYLGVADSQRFWNAFEKTSFYRMMKDDAIQQIGAFQFMKDASKAFRERLAEALEKDIDSLKNPFAGPMAVYMTVDMSLPEEFQPGGVLIAGVGDKALMKDYYDTAVRNFKKKASKYESESAGDARIDYFVTEDDDADDPNGAKDSNDLSALESDSPFGSPEKMIKEMFATMPPRLAMTMHDDRLYVASDMDRLKAALRIERRGETLADSDAVKQMRRHFDPLGDLRMVVNLPKIMDLVREEEGDEAAKNIKVLGFDAFGPMIAHARYGDEELESFGEALFLINGERTGVARILSMENAPVRAIAEVPAETAFFVAANFEIPRVLDEIERITRQFDPDEADQMREALSAVPGPDDKPINVRAEFIEKFKSPIEFMMSFRKPYGLGSTGMLFSLGHNDQAAMQRLMELMQTMGMPLMQRELQGAQILDSPMGGVSVTATNDQLAIGSKREIDQLIQGGSAETLAAREDFRALAEHLPADASVVFYSDARRMYEVALELLPMVDQMQMVLMQNVADGAALGMTSSMLAGVKPDEIDAARAMLKYQSTGLGVMRTTPDGLHFISVQGRPKGN